LEIFGNFGAVGYPASTLASRRQPSVGKVLPAKIGGVAMKSSALIPLAVLVVAYSAQSAESPDPAGPPVSHFQGSCESDPEGTKFASKACYTIYDPGQAGFGASYRPPICDKSHAVTAYQKEVLAKAYSRAPDYVKAKLCRLTQLFVRSHVGPWGSWGFWEGPDRPPGKGVYIAISARELRRASEKSVAEAENEITGELLGLSDRGRHHRPRLARLRTVAPPDPPLTVLAALAHELGHVLLADSNTDGTNARHPRRKVSGPPQSACFETAFLGLSWDAERFHRHMRRWVDFGKQYHNRPVNPHLEFNLNRLRAAVREGKVGAANDAIRDVYRSAEFLSFNAAVNPWEDVVDVYKYKVLADTMPNLTIEFHLRGKEINVLDYLKSVVPAKKVECLRDLGFLTGQP
jgi:hypothetical protein